MTNDTMNAGWLVAATPRPGATRPSRGLPACDKAHPFEKEGGANVGHKTNVVSGTTKVKLYDWQILFTVKY